MKLHDIIANYCIIAISEQAVLAKSLSPNAPEPYVCWHHDADGEGVHTGQYFADKETAEWCFVAQSFEWFKDNALLEMLEDAQCYTCGGEGYRERSTTEALEENIKKYGVPDKVLVDDGSSFNEINYYVNKEDAEIISRIEKNRVI